MLVSELVNLVRKICRQKSEEQTVEVKAAQKGVPTRLYDTLSSFSNQDQGGVIVFGIDEKSDFKVVGVYDPQDLQKKVTEQCNQMEPPVRALFTLAEINGLPVCSAEIPGIELAERPCFYKGTGRVKGSYIRVGDADLPMTDYELYSFEAYRKHLHDDERPVNRASVGTLDTQELNTYVEIQRNNRPGFSKLPEKLQYEMLNITNSGAPTLAAVMNFGVYPQGYFPQLCITAVSVPGTEIGDVSGSGVRFLDNSRIEGTILQMSEEALKFCIRNMKNRTIIDPKTGQRTDRTEYPVDAIREAVLNALIHRDYSIYTEGTPVQIDMFSDRMEIHSPGCLYGRMSVEQLGYAKPDLRNPALAVMAEMLTGAENRYSGIPTMRRAMAEFNLPEPEFENRRNEFVVIFRNTKNNTVNGQLRKSPDQDGGGNSARDREAGLLVYCQVPRSRQEIADFLHLRTTSYVMSEYIKPLLESGRLALTLPEKPGSRNQKFYTVPDENTSE